MRRRWPDVLGLLWVVTAAFGLLAPTLIHGASFGPFDLLARFGLSKQSVVVPNSQGGDVVNAINAWTSLAWQQVHQGHLPLWNPYSGLGMPLAFNWQSAPFSVPAAIGYLFPLRLDVTVQAIVTLMIAGSGVYTLARYLRIGVVGAAFAATAFELSGPMVGWLGWPHSATMSWVGWLFVTALLIVRGRRRAVAIALFAVVIACCIYAGQPEIVILMAMALGLFLAIYLWLWVPAPGHPKPIRRPICDLTLGAAAGAALAAPLLIPGLELASSSLRGGIPSDRELPIHNLTYLLFQGFDGLPIAGSHWFGYFFYVETAAYVGVITLVMAVTAGVLRRRRPEVVALTAVALMMAAIAYAHPVNWILDNVPGLGHILWHRSLIPMAFAVAMLGGMGVDSLVRHWTSRAVQRWASLGFVVSAVALAGLWLFGRGNLSAAEVAIRSRSFLWPAIEVGIGIAVMGTLIALGRIRRGNRAAATTARGGAGQWAGIALLACETAFLLSAGIPMMHSSSSYFSPTPAETTLRENVGSSLVGMGASTLVCTGLGIIPNINVALDVKELALYDPLIPSAYFSSFQAQTGQSAGALAYYSYCPAITSVALAHLYGVSYVLEPAGVPGPVGTAFVTRLGDEALYRVPGSSAATFVPQGSDRRMPTDGAPGSLVKVLHPRPSSWVMRTSSATPGLVRLRLTDVPGWRATIDGRPLELTRFAGIMLQARVPAGVHTIELTYWPTTFSAGIVLAAVAASGLIAAVTLEALRRRRSIPRQQVSAISK